jgi:chemotaxis protein MotB
MAEPPIIIKKVKKKGGHGHHGGAWKLAYADFVTAMMAFFLLMWLLGSTDEVTKRGISEYFQDPYEASRVDKGKVPTLDEIDPTQMDKQAEQEDKMHLEALKIKIEKMIKESEKLSEFKDQIQLTTTPEGLRVQIVDDKKTPMFKLGSSETAPQIRLILKALAPVINGLPNKITINGHTDSTPFPKNSKQYTNWELSSDRANAARFELNQGGYDEKKILRISGLSDSIPQNVKDPLDPMNRRISIIVMNRKTELQLLEESGSDPAAKDKAASGAAKKPPAGAAVVSKGEDAHTPEASSESAPEAKSEAAHSDEPETKLEEMPESEAPAGKPAEAKPESAPDTEPAAKTDEAHSPEKAETPSEKSPEPATEPTSEKH